MPDGFDNLRDKTLKEAVKSGARRFIITSATNNAPKFKSGWESLKTYAGYIGAELAVIPVHYKNISLYTANQEYKKSWPKDLEPYLITKDIYIGGNIMLKPEVPIQATAVNPLSGVEAIDGLRTCVYGHPQLQMKPVGAPANKLPKRVWTTGSISQKNYSSTKMGAKGKFHHVTSALIIEIEGRHTFIRPLCIDSHGVFYDLHHKCTPRKVTSGHRVETLTTGDEHEKFMLRSVRKATYSDKNSIVKTLKPKLIFRHDILDGYTGSHHHLKSPLVQFKKHWLGEADYRLELESLVKHLNESTPDFSENRIVASNHDDHFDKWLDRSSANTDHINAMLILDMQTQLRKSIIEGKPKSALQLYLEPRLAVKTRFLSRNEPHVHLGVDYSQHFDVGTNGSRGGVVGLAKTSYKMTGGHSHSAHIEKSVWQAGKSTGRLEYENGLSTHTNTHIIQYSNSKRSILDVLGGKYCASIHLELI